MTDLARVDAAQRATRIRAGMVAYVHTLADIAEAYAARDWETLGYHSWDTYVAGEFGETRLRLTREQRAEAVTALRVEGMSTRAIGAALGVDQATVVRDLAGDASASPAGVAGTDGKTYAPRPAPKLEPFPLNEAMREALGRAERNAAAITAARDEVREINAATSPELLAWAREREFWIGQGSRLVRACQLLIDEVTADPGQLFDEIPDNVRDSLAVVPAAHDLLTRLRKEMEARS